MSDTEGFDLAQLNVWGDELEFAVERERIVAYSEATNDPFRQHLDGLYAPPVFAVVPPFGLMAEQATVRVGLSAAHSMTIAMP